MERGTWRATVHGVTESDITERLSTHTPTLWRVLCSTQSSLIQMLSSPEKALHILQGGAQQSAFEKPFRGF